MNEKMEEEGLQKLSSKVETIARGAGVTFFGDFFGKGLGYLSQVVVARLLGVQFFGYYALGLTLYKFTSLLAQLGLNNGVLHFVPKFQGEENDSAARGAVVSGLSISFLFGAIITLGIYLGAPWISRTFFNDPNLTAVLQTYSFGVPFFALMMVALYSTRSQKRMKYFVYVKNLQLQITFMLVFLFLYLAGLKLYGAIWAWIIATVISCGTGIFFLIKVFPDLLDRKKTYKITRLLKFSVPLVLVGIFQFLILWTDTFMLGALSSAENVGLYRASVQTALMLGIVLRAFNSIFAPMISDLYHQSEKETLSFLFKTITRWIIILTLPVFVLILASGNSLLRIFGPSFTVVWVPLIILGFAQLMDASMGPVGYMLVMSGNQRLEFYNVLTVALINILLNYIMIPRFNMLGAAIATGTSVIIVNLLRLAAVSTKLGLWPYSRDDVPQLILSFLFVILTGFLWRFFGPNLHFVIDIMVTFLLVGSVQLGSLLALGPNRADRMVFKSIKKTMYNKIS